MRKELRLAHLRGLEKRLEDERRRAEVALQVEEKEQAVLEAYLGYRARGIGHREAIHRVRKDIVPNWSIEITERTIRKRENKAKRERRARELYEAYLSGVSARELASKCRKIAKHKLIFLIPFSQSQVHF